MLLVSGDPDPKILAQAVTDAAGRYRLEETPPPSSYRFLRIVCVRDNRAVAWTTVPYCSGTGVDLRLLPTTSVAGRVADGRGKALEGATVSVTEATAAEHGVLANRGDLADAAPSARTGADGHFTLDGLPRGSEVSLVARHPDYGTERVQGVATAGAHARALEIRLPNGIVIEGTVRLKSTGAPVEGAKVTLGYPADPPMTTTSDKQGHYRFGGVDKFDGTSQRDVHAEAGGSPPKWEGQAYYEKPLRLGDRATVDVLLEPSASSRLADWQQKPGKPLEGRSRVAVLDDADPDWTSGRHRDTVVVRDTAGTVLWRATGLNVCQDIGGGHKMAADPQRGTLWAAEVVGGRLINYSRDGAIAWEKPNVSPHAIAIDPKTGNAWVLTQSHTIYGDALLVFSPAGEPLHDWKIQGYDIAYSARDDCFWVTGKELVKVAKDGKVLAKAPESFPWTSVAVSVNERDGSVWVAEGRHPNVTDSRGRIWIFGPDARPRKSFSVDVDSRGLVVDTPRKAAWVMGRRGVFKLDLDGNVLAEAPVGWGSLCVESDTGYVWAAGREAVWRLDTDAKPVWREATPKTQKWVSILPP
jgi:hypothetical protein